MVRSHPFDETHEEYRTIANAGRRICSLPIAVDCAAFVNDRSKHIDILALINGFPLRVKLPRNDAGHTAIKYFRDHLENGLIACVNRLLIEASKKSESKAHKQLREYHRARMTLTKKCLNAMAELRATGKKPTQAAVCARIYNNTAGSAYFSMELRRKRISFKKLLSVSKRSNELTHEEIEDLSLLETYSNDLNHHSSFPPWKKS